jgi:hypothetical protein
MSTGRRIALVAATAAVVVVTPAAASAKTVVASGEGDSTYVLKGQTLRVKLPAGNSGSTGYHWQQDKQARELRLASHRPSSDGRFDVFAYRTQRAGIASLPFSYRAPGRDGGVARRFDLVVFANNRWRAPGCRPKGSRTIVQNSKARVFTLKRKVYWEFSEKPVAFTGHFGCVFGGRAFGFDEEDSNNPEKAIPLGREYFLPTLRGTKFGHALLDGGTLAHPYTDAFYVARTIDLRKGKVIREASPAQGGPGLNDRIEDLVMSASGGLAWTEASREGAVVARSDEPPSSAGGVARDRTVLDDGQSGAVDPKSLELDGADVTWLRGGALQRAPLR